MAELTLRLIGKDGNLLVVLGQEEATIIPRIGETIVYVGKTRDDPVSKPEGIKEFRVLHIEHMHYANPSFLFKPDLKDTIQHIVVHASEIV